MRNFLLASATADLKTGDIDNLSVLTDGQLAFIKEVNGAHPYVGIAAASVSGFVRGNIVMGRTGNAGPVVLPLFKHCFSYSKMVYNAATTFQGTVTVPAPSYAGTYTVIIVKKGVQFNERNKWSADVYVRDTNMTNAQLATAIAAQINNNTVGSGVSATVASNVITITATEAGVDYEILVADCLSLAGGTTSITAHGIHGLADSNMILDMANKAAADAGFNYTYQDDTALLYPEYPINRGVRELGQYGFTVYTLKFSEPRETKTTDEPINQIVQIAIPYSAAATPGTAVTKIDALLAALV